MALRIVTLRERPRIERDFARLHARAWPPFLRDAAVNALWPTLYRDFPDYQLALCDRGRVVAVGNAIPIPWNGKAHGLPDRIADLIKRGMAGRRPTALAALAVIVRPDQRARGHSARMVRALRRLAATNGLRALVVPVRPALKGAYPLADMKQYAAWKRPDGAPFDPWLRVHWRLGARILRVTPCANTVDATLADWERWTKMRFPASGRYVVPGAFQPITVDCAHNRVRYREANIWMLHGAR
jgi:hypothetical protein